LVSEGRLISDFTPVPMVMLTIAVEARYVIEETLRKAAFKLHLA